MDLTIQSITDSLTSQYLKVGYGFGESYEKKPILLDANYMQDLARIMRSNSPFASQMFTVFRAETGVIFFPEIIIKESAGNAYMTEERYRNLYENLFKEFSQNDIEMYLLSFKDVYRMLNASYSNSADILELGLTIARHLFELDTAIMEALANVNVFEDIETAICVHPDDAGERVLLFLTCILISEGHSVQLYSNEDVAVYGERFNISKNEALTEIMRLSTNEQFSEAFQLKSFDNLCFDILRFNSDWTDMDRLDFLKDWRKNKGRYVRISAPSLKYIDTKPFATDAEFLKLYHSHLTTGIEVIY